MNEQPNQNQIISQPKKSNKALKVTGITLLVIALIVLASLCVYLWQQNEMATLKREYDSKLAAAQAEHDKTNNDASQNNTDDRPAHELTPPKTSTSATCNADELTLSLAQSDGGGAGTLNQSIVLTNTGKRECTLFGFPGVSLVNDNGNMIGAPAERAKNYQEKTITLMPNSQTKATVSFSEPGNFPSGTCKTGATKLRVYPPNDTGYLSVASPMITAWCPGFMISPVQ
ncbi:MAG TPA: DUF4232 domain-containing protein [Candidatus Saccharimonadales bacterium]|nr:DUF4232 domain-containing protein [Candidatus Saccharimonadales bacterium]